VVDPFFTQQEMSRFIPIFRDHDEDVFTGLWRGAVSEFTATMMFIFYGCGSVVATQATLGEAVVSPAALTAIALAHGFAITVLIYAVGEVSGGHINPAVTWACLITKKISILRAVIYWVCQISGAIIGALILSAIVPSELVQYGLGCHGIHSSLTPAQGWFAETVFTAFFIFVVFATAISPFAGKLAPLAGGDYGPGKLTPLAVGLTIVILHLVGIPITGASMNPARSFGPAVVAGGNCWNSHWIYWVGPLSGSTISAILSSIIFLSNPDSLLKILDQQKGNASGNPTPKVPEGAVPLETEQS